MRLARFILVFVLAILPFACDFAHAAEPSTPGPQSPTDALSSMVPRPGFEVELVACEPLVMDPVAFAWGPDGKFWVVEMADYPLGIDGNGKFGGRVKYLEDLDDDGRYDRATLFLDGLGYPTGVMPWRKGVLVTCAPEIFYAEDTDGDGRADLREQLYVGFGEGNQQHRVNGLRWGLDNWIHCANGDSGGMIKSRKTGEAINISGRDFRIRPSTGAIEAQTGLTQFGREADDWGDWFGSKNSNPLFHWLMPEEYLRRSPHVPAGQTSVEVPSILGAAPVFPASKTLPRFNDLSRANRFTSACGGCIYRDDLLGPEFAGNYFVCEPVHNLVHREVVKPKGVTFTSQRARDEQASEFLASTDNWFRPVMARTGPDGALWIADMYRETIEHPQWIPKDWQAKLDLRAGHDKGRIYRVYPIDSLPREIPQLQRRAPDDLARELEHPSGTIRDLAQQLLIEKYPKHPAALFRLKRQVHDSHLPVARLHSLCTLDGMDALTPEVLAWGVEDLHPAVRRHAVRLSEPHLGATDDWNVGKRLLALVADADVKVRLQVAFTLGAWNDPRAGVALGEIALADRDDPFIVAAVMTSLKKENVGAVIDAVGAGRAREQLSPALVERLISLAIALGNEPVVMPLVETIGAAVDGNYQRWQFAALGGFLDGLDRRRLPLATLRDQPKHPLHPCCESLESMFRAARKQVADESLDEAERDAAIVILGRGPDQREADIALLEKMLSPRTPSRLQTATIAALARLDGPQAGQALVAHWRGYGPELRGQALDALLSRAAWTNLLFEAMERGEVSPSDLGATRTQRLVESKEAKIRDRAAKLLAGAIRSDRREVVEEYRDVLQLSSDPARGVEVFRKRCSTCHKIGDVGHAVGPDLAALTDKSPASLLVATLDPNRAVEAKFINYIALTNAGLAHTGIIESESGNSITLLAPEGKRIPLARADLEELASTSKSLMPEGMEKDLMRQDLADVFAWLGQMRPPRKIFAGNTPQLVRPEALRGEFYLLAEQSEIYGSTLVWEPRYGNLGYWNSENDHAAWSAAIEKPGDYDVSLEYACDDAAAGNIAVFTIAGQKLSGKVAGTGNWDTYKAMTLGKVTLETGTQQVIVRSEGKPRGALFDLKSVRLRPVK